jgi:hypothetical protein
MDLKPLASLHLLTTPISGFPRHGESERSNLPALLLPLASHHLPTHTSTRIYDYGTTTTMAEQEMAATLRDVMQAQEVRLLRRYSRVHVSLTLPKGRGRLAWRSQQYY